MNVLAAADDASAAAILAAVSKGKSSEDGEMPILYVAMPKIEPVTTK